MVTTTSCARPERSPSRGTPSKLLTDPYIAFIYSNDTDLIAARGDARPPTSGIYHYRPHGHCITNFRARGQDRRSSGQNSSVDPAGAYWLGQIDSGAPDPARPRLIWGRPNRRASAETVADPIACRSNRRRTRRDFRRRGGLPDSFG